MLTGEVITVIELLLSTNKVTRDGRLQYERKRLQVLGSATHLIEIDLLRIGKPFPFRLQDGDARHDYRIIVSRAQHRPQAAIYLFTIRDPLPVIPVPLRPGEAEPRLTLNHLLHAVYDRAGYDLTIDYHQAPPPPIREYDAQWLRRC